MQVGWVYHDLFTQHDTGPRHPERADRLRAIVQGIKQAGLDQKLTPLKFKAAPLPPIEAVHDADYLRRAHDAFDLGQHHLDPDTPINDISFDAAMLASGGILAACDAVMAGEVKRAFCAVRPPGHHAERDRAMGFCIINHVAVAAQHLISHHGLQRVAIVDFDVHHGNGTQHIFEDRADVLFISIHEDPTHLYPGTGYAHEIGKGPGEGFTLNIPMDPHTGDKQWIDAMQRTIVPRLHTYKPQFLILSAGFDAAADDPLAHIEMTTEGFAAISRHLVAAADDLCGGRIVSSLEGGYDLRSLSQGVNAHLQALLSHD
jgi:acetoin utilization deacetylase AcuC-like enzyme